MAHGTHSSSGYHSQGSRRANVWKLTEGYMGYFQWYPTQVRRGSMSTGSIHQQSVVPGKKNSQKREVRPPNLPQQNSWDHSLLQPLTLKKDNIQDGIRQIYCKYYQWSRRDKTCFLKPSTITELILPALDKLCPECGQQSRQCANNSFLRTQHSYGTDCFKNPFTEWSLSVAKRCFLNEG